MDNIHVGRDGWLFLVGGTNDVVKYFTCPNHFDQARGMWLELLRERQHKAAELGVVYKHMIVPDKLAILPEAYRGVLSCLDRAPSRSVPAAARDAGVSSALVDILPRFLRAKADRQLYYKTDSHWTFDGACEAYRELCAAVAAVPNLRAIDSPRNTAELALDLGGKLDPRVTEVFSLAQVLKDAVRVEANELVRFKEANGLDNEGGLHVGSAVSFRNERALDQRRLMIFGDSYSEYRPVLLTGLLAETFASTVFVWSPSVDWRLVRQFKPDILVTELAERFMGQLPADDLDLNAFAQQRLAHYKQQRGL